MNWKSLYDFVQSRGYVSKWGKNSSVESWIPVSFVSLYKDYDPLDVELPYNGNSLNMVPYRNLVKTLNEYQLDRNSLVFAVCNGDPFFLNAGRVYTLVHGVRNPDWECVGNSVEEFFHSVISA